MKRFLPTALLAVIALLVWSAEAQTTKKKSPVKKKATPTNSSVAKKGVTKKGATKKQPAVTWRNRQLAPTPARYKEIQSALAAKGYMKPEDATGTWNQDSIDALKRFQQDQKLDPNGKINSLSLIALGLGPKHEATAASPPAPPK
jgi:hypothetical protein